MPLPASLQDSHLHRTQQQRRETTIARLLDASIAITIIEFGYARTSAALIAKRAQVSGGALFRHFPTMRDLMAANGPCRSRHSTPRVRSSSIKPAARTSSSIRSKAQTAHRPSMRA